MLGVTGNSFIDGKSSYQPEHLLLKNNSKDKPATLLYSAAGPVIASTWLKKEQSSSASLGLRP